MIGKLFFLPSQVQLRNNNRLHITDS